MLDLLEKLSAITKETIPTDSTAQKKFAVELVNGCKLQLAQHCAKLDKEDLEAFLFRAEIQAEVTKLAFSFAQLNLSKRFNVKFSSAWEASEETKKAKKVGYEPGEKKAVKKKKTTTSGDIFEKRGKSVEDRVIIDIAKGLLAGFKHLPEQEAIAAAFQMAKSQFEKIQKR